MKFLLKLLIVSCLGALLGVGIGMWSEHTDKPEVVKGKVPCGQVTMLQDDTLHTTVGSFNIKGGNYAFFGELCYIKVLEDREDICLVNNAGERCYTLDK